MLESKGARNAWMNHLWRDYAAKHADVRLLDLSSVLCPGGDPRGMVHGIPLRPNGAALSAQGVAYIWSWLAPQAVAAHRANASASNLSGARLGSAAAPGSGASPR
jgi:hypothetical protein